MTTTTYEITGLDHDTLAEVLRSGTDHAGASVEAFEDEQGGWPLRCCLTDSRPGDRLAIVGFAPFPWRSAYSETGPVVVHTAGCPGPHDGSLPRQFGTRPQVLRAYGADAGRQRTQVYELHRLAEPGELHAALTAVLADERVEMVHARNVLSGCYSFTATRAV